MCAEAHLVSGEGKLGFQLEFFFSLLVTHEATVKDPRQFRQIHRGTGTNRPRRHYWIRATLVPNQTAMVPTAYLPSGPLTAVRQGSLWGVESPSSSSCSKSDSLNPVAIFYCFN